MKKVAFLTLIVLTLSVAACGAPASASPTPSPVPIMLADTTIISDGRLEPIRFADIALSATGLVSEVLVKEGDRIKPGQVIARLVGPNTRTLEDAQMSALQEVNAAYDAMRQTQLALDNFDIPNEFSGQTPGEAVAATLKAVNEARAAYDPYKDYGANNSTRREFRDRLDNAWTKYRKAIQWMQLTTDVEAAQTRLTNAQADLDLLNDPNFAEDAVGRLAILANAELRAPFGGTVMSLNLKVGEYASAGQVALTLADDSTWVVKTTDLTEIDVVKLSDGQPVTVVLDAMPGETLEGTILLVARTHFESQGDVVYEVTILLTQTDPLMRWGMTAEVKFE